MVEGAASRRRFVYKRYSRAAGALNRRALRPPLHRFAVPLPRQSVRGSRGAAFGVFPAQARPFDPGTKASNAAQN